METANGIIQFVSTILGIGLSILFLIAILHIFSMYKTVNKNSETLDKMAEQLKDLHRHVMPEDEESAGDTQPKKSWPERRERR